MQELGQFEWISRNYDISIWTLQDSFIATLKGADPIWDATAPPVVWPRTRQAGHVENAKMSLNMDGTQTLKFDVPMYIRTIDGERMENPSWSNVANDNILVSMRKIKVIFNKNDNWEGNSSYEKGKNTFEFLITKVTESHKEDNLICSIECEGLAFHELGKVGFKRSLSTQKFLDEYNEWKLKEYEAKGNKSAAQVKIEAEPKANLQYWMSEAGIPSYDETVAAHKPINSAQWYYQIRMAATSTTSTHVSYDPSKIYEDSYATDWDTDLKPIKYVIAKEKQRLVEINESNLYNITQDLAEKFGVFCRYEYGYDNNYNITSKLIVFYNNFLTESDGVTTLMYPNTAQEISRTMDSIDITSKMFVRSVTDDTTYSGSINIIDSNANKSKEDYLLNFKYLYEIGTITKDQYDYVSTFEKKMRELNSQIIPLQQVSSYLQDVKTKLEAKQTTLTNSISLDKERITETGALMAQLVVEGKADSDGYITVDWKNPDVLYLIKDTSDSLKDTYYVKFNQNGKVGVDEDSVKIYKTCNYTTSTGLAEYAVTSTVPTRCYPENYDTYESLQLGLNDVSQAWSKTVPDTKIAGENKGKYVWTRLITTQVNGSKTRSYKVQYVKNKDDETVNEYINQARFIFYKKVENMPALPSASNNPDLAHVDTVDQWNTYMPTWETDEDEIYYITDFRTSTTSHWYGLSTTDQSELESKTFKRSSGLVAEQLGAAETRLTDELKGEKKEDDYGNLEKITGLFPSDKFGNYYSYMYSTSGARSSEFQSRVVNATWSTSRPTPAGDDANAYYMWVKNAYKYANGYTANSYIANYYKNGVTVSPDSSADDCIKSYVPIFYLKTTGTVTEAPSTPTSYSDTKKNDAWTAVLPDKPTSGNYQYYISYRISTFATSSNTSYVTPTTLDSSSFSVGSSTDNDVPKYIYATYRYKPDLYYEAIKDTWTKKLDADETELQNTNTKLDNISGRLKTYDEKCQAKLDEQSEERAYFERLMGAALRESYWQPEDEYQNYGTPHHDSLTFDMLNNLPTYPRNQRERAIYTITNSSTMAGLGFDAFLYDDEEDIFYTYSILEEKKHYPCIDLTQVHLASTNQGDGGASFFAHCKGELEKISFYFNPSSNTIPAGSSANDVRYMKSYTVGSEAQVGFLWTEDRIVPVIYLTGAYNLSDAELDNMYQTGRLGKISVETDPDNTNCSILKCNTPYVVPESAWLNFNDKTGGLVYPRIKIDSLNLKRDTEDLVVKLKDLGSVIGTNYIALDRYKQFYLLTKNYYKERTNSESNYSVYSDISLLSFGANENEKLDSYQGVYTITIKPSFLFDQGIPVIQGTVDLTKFEFEIYYSISNAATDIYLDAYNILKENAYPKVSYAISTIPLYTDFSNYLYQKIGQVVMINDADLKFKNTFGYISSVELNLDFMDQDTIEVKNYKTKFEDLFSKIVAETEEMHKNSYNIGLAGALGTGGSVNSPLTGSAFADTVGTNADVLLDFLNSYFDDGTVAQTKIREMFNEAGEILASAYNSLNNVVGLTYDNANTLAGFRENVAAALTPNIFTGSTPPSTFKAGDVWINEEDGEAYRGIAITGSASGGSFVQTYNGKLSEISGANVKWDANTGIVDITGQTQINLSSGNTVTIAANDTVEIIGNKSVNIGGTAINIASCRVLNEATGESDINGGIHLVATDYTISGSSTFSGSGDRRVEQVDYTMKTDSTSYVDVIGEGITMASKNGIVIKSGAGIDIKSASDVDVSAIRLDSKSGIYMASTAPLKFYSGSACNIFYGPYRSARFEKGDYWYKTAVLTNDDSEILSNLDENDNQLPSSENPYQLNKTGTIHGTWYRAIQSWTEVYGVNGDAESASQADNNSTPTLKKGWQQLEEAPEIKGANVELSSEHLILGVADISSDSATAIEMDKEQIILAAGKDLSTIKANYNSEDGKYMITDMVNSSISGVQIASDYIGMATGSGNSRSLISLKPGIVKIGQMRILAGDNVDPDLPENYSGSFVWFDHGDIYIGAVNGNNAGNLTLNTNNVKIQTKALAAPGTISATAAIDSDLSSYVTSMGFCLGKNLQGQNNQTPEPKLGFWIDTNGNAQLRVDGDIVANTLVANGSLIHDPITPSIVRGPVFYVNGNKMGIWYKETNKADQQLFYFNSDTGDLYITGTLYAANMYIDEGAARVTWAEYWNSINLDYMGTIEGTIEDLLSKAGEIIGAAATSLADVQQINMENFDLLTSFYEDVSAKMTPNTYVDNGSGQRAVSANGAAAPYFKTGDIWKHTVAVPTPSDADPTATTNMLETFVATADWDELYYSEKDGVRHGNTRGAAATDNAALTSTNGWTRTSDGRLAGISGASTYIDADKGIYEIKAGKKLSLLCNGLIDISGQDVKINGNKTLEFTGPRITMTSSITNTQISELIEAGSPLPYGGIKLTSTISGYTGNETSLNGTSTVILSGYGIELASKGGIVIKSGAGIDIKASSSSEASVLTINKADGIKLLSDVGISLGTPESAESGSFIDIKKDRILIGVTGHTNTYDASAIDITRNEMIFAVGSALQRFNGSTLIKNMDVSGVQITAGYIGLAVQSQAGNSAKGLVSLSPEEILIGVGTTVGTTHDGSYIKITNDLTTQREDNTLGLTSFEIGSTGRFAIYSPTFMVDNAATGPDIMFKLAQAVTSNNNTTYTNVLTFTQDDGLYVKGQVTATEFVAYTDETVNPHQRFYVNSSRLGFYNYEKKNNGTTAITALLTIDSDGKIQANQDLVLAANKTITINTSNLIIDPTSTKLFVLKKGNTECLSFDTTDGLVINGSIEAETGTIGGWTIDGSSIVRDAGGGTAYLHHSVTSDAHSPYAIYVGSSGEFRVSYDGTVWLNKLIVAGEEIDFSGITDFNSAVSLTGAWGGGNSNEFEVKARFFNKEKLTASRSLTASFTVHSAAAYAGTVSGSGSCMSKGLILFDLTVGDSTKANWSITFTDEIINTTAVFRQGYEAACNLVDGPTGSGASVTIKTPKVATIGPGANGMGQDEYTFTLVADNTPTATGNAYIRIGLTTYATLAIGDWYKTGYNAAITAMGNGANYLTGYSTINSGNSIELFYKDGTSAGNYVWRHGGSLTTKYDKPTAYDMS